MCSNSPFCRTCVCLLIVDEDNRGNKPVTCLLGGSLILCVGTRFLDESPKLGNSPRSAMHDSTSYSSSAPVGSAGLEFSDSDSDSDEVKQDYVTGVTTPDTPQSPQLFIPVADDGAAVGRAASPTKSPKSPHHHRRISRLRSNDAFPLTTHVENSAIIHRPQAARRGSFNVSMSVVPEGEIDSPSLAFPPPAPQAAALSVLPAAATGPSSTLPSTRDERTTRFSRSGLSRDDSSVTVGLSSALALLRSTSSIPCSHSDFELPCVVSLRNSPSRSLNQHSNFDFPVAAVAVSNIANVDDDIPPPPPRSPPLPRTFSEHTARDRLSAAVPAFLCSSAVSERPPSPGSASTPPSPLSPNTPPSPPPLSPLPPPPPADEVPVAGEPIVAVSNAPDGVTNVDSVSSLGTVSTLSASSSGVSSRPLPSLDVPRLSITLTRLRERRDHRASIKRVILFC